MAAMAFGHFTGTNTAKCACNSSLAWVIFVFREDFGTEYPSQRRACAGRQREPEFSIHRVKVRNSFHLLDYRFNHTLQVNFHAKLTLHSKHW